MIELVAKHLKRKDIGRLFIANRSLDRAQELAGRFGGFALPLSELEGTLSNADILISSTASPDAVVTQLQMAAAVRARKRKPMFAVDIAVPRDFEAEVAELDDVYLYTDRRPRQGHHGRPGSNREAAAVDANRILDATKSALPVVSSAARKVRTDHLRSFAIRLTIRERSPAKARKAPRAGRGRRRGTRVRVTLRS